MSVPMPNGPADELMTRVEFHYNIADKARYLARLLQKVLDRDMTALVVCPADQLLALDQRLWSDDPGSFLPHCRMDASPLTRASTAIWLADSVPGTHDRQVLINWGTLLPQGPGPVRRWLELVGTDPADAQAGRQRWRDYQARGFSIEPHDRGGR